MLLLFYRLFARVRNSSCCLFLVGVLRGCRRLHACAWEFCMCLYVFSMIVCVCYGNVNCYNAIYYDYMG